MAAKTLCDSEQVVCQRPDRVQSIARLEFFPAGVKGTVWERCRLPGQQLFPGPAKPEGSFLIIPESHSCAH